jgi:FAD/FMN-containing dehydrogenase
MSTVKVLTTAGEHAVLDTPAVEKLQTQLRGELLRPDDAAYDNARRVWNGMVDKRPALIVRCAEVSDVVAAVTFAREHDLLVSVRGGGHNVAGKSVCDGGLMVDLAPINAIHVDPARQTARVDGGAKLRDLDRASQAYGLATTAGVVSSTGVAGLTLGGGVGRLARKYGLACDNLLSVELITADGRIVLASDSENADLFWGVRGGGANLGVVTSFEYQLHPLGPQVLGGVVIHPFERITEALRFYHEYSRQAPDEVSADAIVMNSPEGVPVLAISACYIGSVDEGESALRPLREFGPPVMDQIAPVPYTDLQASADIFFPDGLNYYWKSHFLKEIGPEVVEAVATHFPQAPSPLTKVLFQQYGGAVGRVARSQTAFWHRDAEYDFIPTSIWTDPSESEEHFRWGREIWEAVRPFSDGVYVNNLGDEGEDEVKKAYGDNYTRLAALKSKYDPTNFFRLNPNVKPAA